MDVHSAGAGDTRPVHQCSEDTDLGVRMSAGGQFDLSAAVMVYITLAICTQLLTVPPQAVAQPSAFSHHRAPVGAVKRVCAYRRLESSTSSPRSFQAAISADAALH